MSKFKSAHLGAIAGIAGALALPYVFAQQFYPDNKLFGYIRGLLNNAVGVDIAPGDRGVGGSFFNFGMNLLHFWGPIALGVGGSMLATEFGLNRAIAAKTRGVPLLNRIRV